VICDAVFTDYRLDSRASFFDPISETEVPLFILNGLSKSAGLPQVKLSWIILRGPEDLKKQSLSHLQLVSDTYLSVGTPAQHAMPALLGVSGKIRSQILARIRANYQSLWKACTGTAVEPLRSEGGWYATLRLPRSRSEEEWSLYLLEAANVLVHPGYFFDFSEEAYVIVSLLVDSTGFDDGVSRLVAAVET
jgi:aspartate/methionine/tyrosine aminotransferase